jgi:hypothetical protein
MMLRSAPQGRLPAGVSEKPEHARRFAVPFSPGTVWRLPGHSTRLGWKSAVVSQRSFGEPAGEVQPPASTRVRVTKENDP